jgi:cytochrome c nitrite reductase small subunit
MSPYDLAARLRRLVLALVPPAGWRLPVAVACGVFVGLFGVTFHISRATSYLTDDPAACTNCHIMAPQYASWQHSSHARHATCNDCHVPADPIGRYAFKAYDGSRHAFMFTFEMEPQVIRIHAPGAYVVQGNCVRCHDHLIEPTTLAAGGAHSGERKCWDCHREVPHGRVNSLASAPHARVPTPDPVRMPAWLEQALDRRPTSTGAQAPGTTTP